MPPKGVDMAGHGGARNRGGRPPEEGSVRSDLGRYALNALPPKGYQGETPAFPLPDLSERESVVWAEAWRTPQAWAWAQPGNDWRIRTVALWVRLSVRCEAPDASATLLGQLHRFADQIGMTTAGLREMGWKIATDSRRTPKPAPDGQATPIGDAPSARRLRG